MKIGIITFHSAHNFGAVLQAYALNIKLFKLGYKAEIIDYRPDFITKLYSINVLDKITQPRSLISLLSMYPTRVKKYNKFKKFIENNLCLSEKKFTSRESLDRFPFDYDVFITGSDQVWNPEINGVMGEYFLDFVKSNAVKISYAASFGVSCLKDQYRDAVAAKLRNLDMISVREDDGVIIVNELLGIRPPRLLDPVFLLNKKDWNEQAITKNTNDKYILVYMMEYNEKLIEIARILSNKYKMKILNISSSIKVPNGVYKNLRDIGPKEFLGYINSAEYIITNSFHGTAFSIIFEKNFLVVPHSKLNCRIETLLNLVGLRNRQIYNTCDVEKGCVFDGIDYTRVRTILENERQCSEDFLLNAIGSRNETI